MGCLLALFAGAFPRLAVIIFWITRPERMDFIFTSFVWPVLGIIFLPFTTIMYMLSWRPTGIQGWDWLWILLGLFLDLANWSQGAANREQVPGYNSAVSAVGRSGGSGTSSAGRG